MKYFFILICLLLCTNAIKAQENDELTKIWFNSSVGGFSKGTGVNFSVDYDLKKLWKPGYASIGIGFGAYWLKECDIYSNITVGVRFLQNVPVCKWLEIYAGTIQGLDFKVLNDEDSDIDEDEFDFGWSWNRWSSMILGGVRFKIANRVSVFGEISIGSPLVRYTTGIGFKLWN